MYRPFLVLALSIALTAGCSGGGSDAAPDAAPDAASDGASGGSGQDQPAATADPDFVPMEIHGGAGGGEIALPGATFALPADWRQEQPTSGMRAAQAQIPGAAGDGQLTVFFFGVGGGGGTESNIQRWIGQVEVDPADPPVRDAFAGDGTTVSWVEARGTLQPSTMGTGPIEPQPGSTLLGAVVEGAGGPWYFKATGPTATMEAQKSAFLAMLGSVRPSVPG